jgi:hypothetical protein
LVLLQTKISKNQEDSAIGSMSCQATHTSESSGSPLKCEHQELGLGALEARVIPEVRVQDNQPLELARSLERAPTANGGPDQILDSGSLRKGTSRFLTPPNRFASPVVHTTSGVVHLNPTAFND